jgi:hypothetical protein
MAGNTKLVGFSPRPEGVGGVVNLERWGGKVTAEISEGSLESLREACTKLPSGPPPGSGDGRGYFNVWYNKSVGRICTDMQPASAVALASLLKDCIELDVPLNHDVLREWSHSLEAAAKAHEEYCDSEGEPGVKDTR